MLRTISRLGRRCFIMHAMAGLGVHRWNRRGRFHRQRQPGAVLRSRFHPSGKDEGNGKR
jgi:hypothetical protein